MHVTINNTAVDYCLLISDCYLLRLKVIRLGKQEKSKAFDTRRRVEIKAGGDDSLQNE